MAWKSSGIWQFAKTLLISQTFKNSATALIEIIFANLTLDLSLKPKTTEMLGKKWSNNLPEWPKE